MSVVVTGAAGFIGYHLSATLLDQGEEVVGIDNLNDYYDVALKEARLAQLIDRPGFTFHRLNIADREAMFGALENNSNVTQIVHLAAQAGVRYSLENPYAYIEANVMGQVVILELCRTLPNLAHLVYASSSSVYGGNKDLPFSEDDRVDHPVSLYAATKKADELMGHVYAHLHGMPMTGLRFFTVYGPWGRPDMAAYIFTKALFEGLPIQLFNFGDMRRDFTYVDDIVDGIMRVMGKPPVAEAGKAPHRIYNIGNNNPEDLTQYIKLLEEATGKTAILEPAPMQPGDVQETYADISSIERDFGFRPQTLIEEGIPRFVRWYRDYHGL
jgi:UDP-glucuronate 4-epimerase